MHQINTRQRLGTLATAASMLAVVSPGCDQQDKAEVTAPSGQASVAPASKSSEELNFNQMIFGFDINTTSATHTPITDDQAQSVIELVGSAAKKAATKFLIETNSADALAKNLNGYRLNQGEKLLLERCDKEDHPKIIFLLCEIDCTARLLAAQAQSTLQELGKFDIPSEKYALTNSNSREKETATSYMRAFVQSKASCEPERVSLIYKEIMLFAISSRFAPAAAYTMPRELTDINSVHPVLKPADLQALRDQAVIESSPTHSANPENFANLLSIISEGREIMERRLSANKKTTLSMINSRTGQGVFQK